MFKNKIRDILFTRRENFKKHWISLKQNARLAVCRAETFWLQPVWSSGFSLDEKEHNINAILFARFNIVKIC